MEQILRMFGVRRNNDLGFTLIELLVVIAIIGILAGIAIPMFMGQRTKAVRSEAVTNLNALFVLNEQHYAEYGRYAPWPDKSNPDSFSGSWYNGTPNPSDFGLEDIFPQFKPGAYDELNFTYKVKTFTGTQGQTFIGYAEGKVGSPAEGMSLMLTHENKWL